MLTPANAQFDAVSFRNPDLPRVPSDHIVVAPSGDSGQFVKGMTNYPAPGDEGPQRLVCLLGLVKLVPRGRVEVANKALSRSCDLLYA